MAIMLMHLLKLFGHHMGGENNVNVLQICAI